MMEKPGRTIGLALAIIISVMLFSLLPLAQVAVFLLLRERSRQIEFLSEGGAVGGNISANLSDWTLIFQVILGLIFLVIAVLAWRGKPASIRFIFVAAVAVLTILTIAMTLVSINTSQTLQGGLDSSAPLANSLLRARLVVSALVSLYVIWYVNRGPARAFYRGYYLPEPTEAQSKP
jgi:hypothetical protein